MIEQTAAVVAQLTAGAFAGSCAYIALVQHPVRTALSPGAALQDFRDTIPRAERLQAPLLVTAMAAVALSAAASPDPTVVLSGLLLFAVLVQTVLAILPINRRLLSGHLQDRLGESPRALQRWGHIHIARTVLAVVGAILVQL